MIGGSGLSGRSRAVPRELAEIIDRRVATRIRERRRQIGMTQQQLARIIGVAFQQAHKYERGISRISAGRLFNIATALDIPISYFFSDETATTHPTGYRQQSFNGGTHGD